MTGYEIRQMQRKTIVAFLWDQDFSGRTLDYGCGAAPYRDIVEASGEWHGWNRAIYPGGLKADIGGDDPFGERWDVVLCTQALQYFPDPRGILALFRGAADRLVLTVATNWPEVEPEDLYRFTRAGITTVLEDVGWKIDEMRELGAIPFGDMERCALGYGVACS